MTLTITKTKLALAVLVMALLVPATAFATHVFDDVDDGAFYAGPVEWAFDNGITTGKTATSFAPLDGVTRGESVTFLKRYDDFVIQPATVGLFASDDRGATFIQNVTSTATDLGLSATATIPAGRTAVLEIEFSAETSCGNGGTGGFCDVTIKSNGTAVGMIDQIIDSSDNGTESGNAWESHTVRRVTAALTQGDYVITVEGREGSGSPVFALRNAMVTVEVHLAS